MDPFDPYQQWLGIPSQMRPINHYILMGLRIFESDSGKISDAYDARLELLKKFQAGPRGELSQRLISEIGKAKRDLSDPQRKSEYDIALKKLLQERQRSLEVSQDEVDAHAAAEMEARQLPAETEQREGLVAVDTQSSVEPNLVAANSELQTEEPAPPQPDQEDSEVLSLFSMLTSVRYLVGLLTLTIIIMAATVKLLGSGESAEPVAAGQSGNLLAAEEPEELETELEPGDLLARVEQSGDGSFEIPIEQASLAGAEVSVDSGVITGWGSGDQVAWMLVINDRGNSYLDCRVTYQAKRESTFEVQLGNRKPRTFTVYPHDDDFEEQFVVRLGTAKKGSIEQVLRIKSLEFDGREFQIKRIRLTPNR